jgi:hypothetical protein
MTTYAILISYPKEKQIIFFAIYKSAIVAGMDARINGNAKYK